MSYVQMCSSLFSHVRHVLGKSGSQLLFNAGFLGTCVVVKVHKKACFINAFVSVLPTVMKAIP